MELGRHGTLGLLLAGHLLLKLPGKDALDGSALDFGAIAFLLEKIIESRTAVLVQGF